MLGGANGANRQVNSLHLKPWRYPLAGSYSLVQLTEGGLFCFQNWAKNMEIETEVKA
jgi:hypothetical protein